MAALPISPFAPSTRTGTGGLLLSHGESFGAVAVRAGASTIGGLRGRPVQRTQLHAADRLGLASAD